MKAEEHPLSQEPLIERITKGKWIIQGPKVQEQSGQKYWTIHIHNSYEAVGFFYPKTPSSEESQLANIEAISLVPELLKAEQELEEKTKSNEWLSDQLDRKTLKISELEETISRQKKEIAERDLSLKLLTECYEDFMRTFKSTSQHSK